MMKINQQAAVIVQVGDNGSLDQTGSSEDGKKQIKLGCVLEVKFPRLADESEVGSKGKRGVSEDSQLMA